MAGRGRPFVVAWDEADTEEALRAAYRAERDVDVRQRPHALWLLRSGERRMDEVADLARTTYRAVQRLPVPTPEQQEHLATEVATGRFRNAVAIRAWVAEAFGVTYTEGAMYSLLEYAC